MLIAPITSQAAVARFPAVVRLAPTPANGLAEASYAMVFQTRALDRSRFVERLGTLAKAEVEAILAELARLTAR